METPLEDGEVRFMVEDLLDFTLDAGEVHDEIEQGKTQKAFLSSNPNSHDQDDQFLSLPDCIVEEELEWILNKDAFPSVDTLFFDIPTDNQSPVSVLENNDKTSSTNSKIKVTSWCLDGSVPIRYPVKARSKSVRKRRRGFPELCYQQRQQPIRAQQPRVGGGGGGVASIGRRCQHCGSEKTPQWRAGPMGAKTLCNACGVRYKSGRLVPEYRPASSPTYSALLHSNSHRKIVEMRRQKQVDGEW
ncbi:GATA transcription factor 1-like [Impatiens glandulifera]|uniref:GATA transcription factor 1-like n=1 Tax=Impatiens glandulifera TaxID=253017 RepID=UPI001FB1150D|nr:GATA transcription factor 1-like [Impatiens glandulifera]